MDVAEQRVIIVTLVNRITSQLGEDGAPHELIEAAACAITTLGEGVIALMRIATALEHQNAMTAIMGRAQGYDV